MPSDDSLGSAFAPDLEMISHHCCVDKRQLINRLSNNETASDFTMRFHAQPYIASASSSSSRAKLFWHANINTQSSLAHCFSSYPTKVLAPLLAE
jgi:hypothetical protein